jgi:hypothetical protein
VPRAHRHARLGILAPARIGADTVALAPYQQGELDALCGLYAIINATRLALSPTRCMKSADFGHFFNFLIGRLHADRMLLYAITGGLSPMVVSRLLVKADRWLGRRFGVTLQYERPHYLKPNASRTRVVRSIARHLAEPNTSAIVVLDGGERYWHWSVVKKVTTASLILFDADGMKRVSFAHAARGRIHLQPRDVYLLRCER